ncbi:MAG: hypothetical protein AB1744_03865 [Candidatus Zixiibacteriota bacterium]
MKQPALVARIALFSALVYVLSWGTSYLPNINFMFFIVFSAGLLWGVIPGILVGAVGMGLWTMLNPYGPAPFPIMISQIIGAASSGAIGALFRKTRWQHTSGFAVTGRLIVSALLCTILFYLPVNSVDALLFQPFWPRFIGGALWAVVPLTFNIVIFPLLFPVTRYLYGRECGVGRSYD